MLNGLKLQVAAVSAVLHGNPQNIEAHCSSVLDCFITVNLKRDIFVAPGIQELC